MDINQQLRRELATGLDIEVLESNELAKAVVAWEKLRDSAYETLDDMPTLFGAYQILEGRKDDPANPMIEVIGMCVKNPGRKTWAVAFGEEFDFQATYWFPVDSVEDALKIVEQNVARVHVLLEE